MNDMDRERLVQVEDRAKSNTKRLDEQGNEIEELKKTYAIMEKMNYRMENVEKSVLSINNKLDKHEEEINKTDKEKGKKWDKLIDYIFYSVIAVILLLVYTKLGLK